ncbi:MAG: F0F1 ATP synthase subunit B family protein [Rhodoplanes sp.]|jgi:F-type H+-transporting ATPase subunit b
MAQPTHATTEATPAQHGGRFPPFKADTFASQLLWLAVCFVVLYVIVAQFALPRMGSILASRRAKIEADFAEAARMKGEADAAVAAHEKALADAHARAHALAMTTRERLAAESEVHRKSVEHELNQRLTESDKTIAASKTAAMANVRGIAVDTAGAIVARLIGSPPSERTVISAVDEVLKR